MNNNLLKTLSEGLFDELTDLENVYLQCNNTTALPIFKLAI